MYNVRIREFLTAKLPPQDPHKPPRLVSLGKLMTEARGLGSSLLLEVQDRKEHAEKTRALVKCLSSKLGVREDLVRMSLTTLPQLQFDAASLRRLALKFLQNKSYLKKGKLLPVWDNQDPVWTVLSVRDIRKPSHKTTKPSREVEVIGLTGPLAGDVWVFTYPVSYLRWLAKEIGFPKYEKAHERDLFRMRAFGLMGAQSKSHPSVTVMKFVATSTLKKQNRRLAVTRLEKNCQQKTYSCATCFKGIDQCLLACRKHTKTYGSKDNGKEE